MQIRCSTILFFKMILILRDMQIGFSLNFFLRRKRRLLFILLIYKRIIPFLVLG